MPTNQIMAIYGLGISDKGNLGVDVTLPLKPATEIEGRLWVVYEGSEAAPADITRSHMHCYWLPRLPMFVPYNAEDPATDVSLPAEHLAAGEAATWTFETAVPDNYTAGDPRSLYVMGAIEFNVTGKKTNTLFCYRFDTAEGRFFPELGRRDYHSPYNT